MSHGFTRVACILLVLSPAICARAQRPLEKVPTGSISGTVTVKGKAVPGIVINARNPNASWRRERHRATTDELGNYHITSLPPGRYEVSPATQLFNLDTKDSPRALLVSEGEAIENVDFALVRGGAITGKVTNADGEPLIEEQIMLGAATAPEGYQKSVVTDDRGIYRFFAVRPGKYRVSAGRAPYDLSVGSRAIYARTFHPAANDALGATVIEVTEAGEVADVDIVMGRPVLTYKISGRVVDGETGKPLANMRYGVTQIHGESSHSTSGGPPTNNEGEFTILNLSPGKYEIYVVPNALDARSEPVAVEITNRDVKDVVIKTLKGASVAGVVVFQGADGRAPIPTSDLLIYVSVSADNRVPDGTPPVSVSKDGTFRIGGLPAGSARFSIYKMRAPPNSGRVGILRIERNGVVQSNNIEIQDGEQVGGLRVTVAEFNGAIRGIVKWEDEDAPVFRGIYVSLARTDDSGAKPEWMGVGQHQWDSRGRFFADGLAPGIYELRVQAPLGGVPNGITTKQQVTVTNNSITEVTLILPHKPNPE